MIIKKSPWSSLGLLNTIVTLVCAAASSATAIFFKHYYAAWILITIFLIIIIAVLVAFYIELRLSYNAVSDKLEQTIDVTKLNKEAMEDRLRQRFHDDFNTSSSKAADRKGGISSQDPKEHDGDRCS